MTARRPGQARPNAASPGEAQPDVALDAVAADVAVGGELIAGLAVEAEARIELVADAAGELDPRRVRHQRHADGAGAVDGLRRAAPVAPDIGPAIGLPH